MYVSMGLYFIKVSLEGYMETNNSSFVHCVCVCVIVCTCLCVCDGNWEGGQG